MSEQAHGAETVVVLGDVEAVDGTVGHHHPIARSEDRAVLQHEPTREHEGRLLADVTMPREHRPRAEHHEPVVGLRDLRTAVEVEQPDRREQRRLPPRRVGQVADDGADLVEVQIEQPREAGEVGSVRDGRVGGGEQTCAVGAGRQRDPSGLRKRERGQRLRQLGHFAGAPRTVHEVFSRRAVGGEGLAVDVERELGKEVVEVVGHGSSFRSVASSSRSRVSARASRDLMVPMGVSSFVATSDSESPSKYPSSMTVR